MSWSNDVTTDYHGNFDTGRWIGVVVVIAMVGIQAWDVVVNKHPFNALWFGGGAGTILAGLWAYLHGDVKQMIEQTKPELR